MRAPSTYCFRYVLLFTFVAFVANPIAAQTPIELIDNGGFEAGDLTRWEVSGPTDDGGCQTNWQVNSVGETGCIPANVPNEGGFAAYNSFDGPGPIVFGLSQAFTVPANVRQATLTWDDFHTVLLFSGQPREFSVDLFDETGVNLIDNLFRQEFSDMDSAEDWVTRTIDITQILENNAGSDLTLSFRNIIPEPFTGPGGFGLDAVSLAVTVPEPTAFGLLSLMATALASGRRRKC